MNESRGLRATNMSESRGLRAANTSESRGLRRSAVRLNTAVVA